MKRKKRIESRRVSHFDFEKGREVVKSDARYSSEASVISEEEQNVGNLRKEINSELQRQLNASTLLHRRFPPLPSYLSTH